MGLTRRLDDYQQRHRWLGFPLAVAYKFFDDQGVYLAALITFYGFLSLFPLLLLLTSIVGFALRGNEDLRQQILDSTLSQFPVINEQLRDPQGLQGSGVALLVGALTALYGALGVAQALQNAMNVMWAVPRNHRPNPLQARGRSVLLIATAGVAVLATTALSIAAGPANQGGLASPVAIVAAVGAVVLNSIIFVAAFRIATARRLGLGELLPGAIVAAFVWQLMQLFGGAYVAAIVKDSSLSYGVFALVLGLLAWTFARVDRRHRQRRDQRRSQQAVVPALTAHAVHRRRRPDRRRSAHLHRSSNGAAPEGVPGRGRHLRTPRAERDSPACLRPPTHDHARRARRTTNGSR